MTPQEPSISVIDPIGPAIEKVKLILFKPFDLGKWFVIGFCAWLAYLGQGGGGGGPNISQNQVEVQQVKDFFVQNAYWLIPVILVGFVMGIVLWVVFIWLSSRGKFMFLHCVATNRAEVKIPWQKFKEQANSLFIFRIMVGLVSFLCLALLVGLTIVLIVLCIRGPGITALFIVGLIFLIPIIIAAGIAVAVLFKFTYDFVVPIMFLGTTSCIDAWREFRNLLSKNKARFALYILFQIVIAIVTGIIGATVAIIFVVILALLTCCAACCFMVIPGLSLAFTYLITVLLLPLSIFKRAYSLLYLRQFGPQFDVFSRIIATD
ncbi:MAG: DUF7544 domain-containing protein [Planctomycetota bacterium]|jgi:hypothetical protein